MSGRAAKKFQQTGGSQNDPIMKRGSYDPAHTRKAGVNPTDKLKEIMGSFKAAEVAKMSQALQADAAARDPAEEIAKAMEVVEEAFLKAVICGMSSKEEICPESAADEEAIFTLSELMDPATWTTDGEEDDTLKAQCGELLDSWKTNGVNILLAFIVRKGTFNKNRYWVCLEPDSDEKVRPYVSFPSLNEEGNKSKFMMVSADEIAHCIRNGSSSSIADFLQQTYSHFDISRAGHCFTKAVYCQDFDYDKEFANYSDDMDRIMAAMMERSKVAKKLRLKWKFKPNPELSYFSKAEFRPKTA